jgi:hypothetical protein
MKTPPHVSEEEEEPAGVPEEEESPGVEEERRIGLPTSPLSRSMKPPPSVRDEQRCARELHCIHFQGNHIVFIFKQSYCIHFKPNNNQVKYHCIDFDSILFLNIQTIAFQATTITF